MNLIFSDRLQFDNHFSKINDMHDMGQMASHRYKYKRVWYVNVISNFNPNQNVVNKNIK